MKKVATLFVAIIISTLGMHSQDLSEFQWKKRVVLILIEDLNNKDLDNQISSFKANHSEVLERKIEMILVTKDKSYMGLDLNKSFSDYSLFKKYKVTQSPFEMVLIGLDGGVKERYTNYQSVEDIFAVIDSMPMRKAEIRKIKN